MFDKFLMTRNGLLVKKEQLEKQKEKMSDKNLKVKKDEKKTQNSLGFKQG